MSTFEVFYNSLLPILAQCRMCDADGLFRIELVHSCINTETVQFKGRDAALDWNALKEIENAFVPTAAASPASYLQLYFCFLSAAAFHAGL